MLIVRPRRLRSILKNSVESRYNAEDTAANTRRNSSIRRCSVVVDLEEENSRYFAHASNALCAPELDPAAHTIMPRRRTTPASYFYDSDSEDVQVEDSGRVVPETSPPAAEYTSANQLSVLRQDAEAVWTSAQSVTTVTPKDLRSLTRTVSRENGTMSQSVVRRRPSLPFQSPRTVR